MPTMPTRQVLITPFCHILRNIANKHIALRSLECPLFRFVVACISRESDKEAVQDVQHY